MSRRFFKIEYVNDRTDAIVKLGLRVEYENDAMLPTEHWEYAEDEKGNPIPPTYFRCLEWCAEGNKLPVIVRRVFVPDPLTPTQLREMEFKARTDDLLLKSLAYQTDARLATEAADQVKYAQKAAEAEAAYWAEKCAIRAEIPQQQ